MTMLAYKVTARVLVIAQGLRTPDADEFRRYLEWMGRQDFDGILVTGEGEGLTVGQRGQIKAFWTERHREAPPTALLTNSAIVRNVITAMNWIGFSNTKGFALNAHEAALDHLRVRREDRTEVIATLETMRKLMAAFPVSEARP